tara:strand:+ start:1734 stop:2624 length:891 start_codon:yes stop_codon:yes gene_type:complete
MTKILIVGGTGFVGYHLAKETLKKGWKVYSISTRKPIKARRIGKVRYIICDITNKKKLQKSINFHFDYVVNLGGYVNHTDYSKTIKSHYYGCKNLVDFFINNPPNSFVQIGSSNEYGRARSPQNEQIKCKPVSIYGKAKLLSTKYLIKMHKKKNFPSVVLRLYQAYGPRQDTNRLIPQAIVSFLNNREFNSTEGKQLRDFIHVDDVIQAIIKSLLTETSRGQIINIGSGKPRNIKSIIIKIFKFIKSGKINFGKIKMRKDEILKIYPSIKKAKKVLRWYPKISFSKGLNHTIKSYD